MTDTRTVTSLGFAGVQEPYLHEYEERPPEAHEVRLDTLYSGFSAGTELTFMKGTNPYLHSTWNGHLGQFEAGGGGYPVPFVGYMEVGRAVSDGGGVIAGTVLAGTWGHKSGHTADPSTDLLVALPAEIDPILGVFVAQMGPIAANGVLHADVELLGRCPGTLGEGVRERHVLVVGGGIVGALCATFAARAGADVVVAEDNPFRRHRLEALGLRALGTTDAVSRAKARWHHGGNGRGADVVLQTKATGAALHHALLALRPQGSVIDLAFYPDDLAGLRLGEEFHHNALSIRCAQIGRVPRGTETQWDRERLARATVQLLLQRGRELQTQLITHVVPIDEAPAFLTHLVRDRPDFLQIVWSFGADG